MSDKVLARLLMGMLLICLLVLAPTTLLAQDTGDLVQPAAMTFEDHTITLMLPEGWLITSVGEGYLFGRDSESLDMVLLGIEQVFDNIIDEIQNPGGEDQATPTPVPFNELVVGMVGITYKDDLAMSGWSLTEYVNENLASPGSPFLVDQLQDMQFGDRPGVMIPMLMEFDDSEAEAIPDNIVSTGVAAVIDGEDFFVTFLGMALAESDQSALFEAILRTMELSSGPAWLVQLPEVQIDHPLVDMIALIPGALADQGEDSQPLIISYIDFQALAQTRPNTPTPQSWQEWNSLGDTDPEGFVLWMANSYRIQSGPQALGRYFMMMETTPEVMGLDYFDIDRALEFGLPPENGFIYAGDFDLEAVAQAHLARDYTETDLGGISLWCGPVGCENGMQQDLQNRDVANIFGGDLGRQFPFLVLPQYLAASVGLPTITGMADAYQGEALSLLNAPAYRAGAEALAQSDGQLVQTQFYPADEFGTILLGRPGPITDQMMALWEGYGALPVYELLVLADFQQGEDQVAMVGLVYTSEEEARTGAEELSQRIVSLPFLRGDQEAPDKPMLTSDAIKGRMGEPAVYYSEAADRWVAIASALYPLPSSADISGDTLAADIAAGTLFRYWVNDLWRGSFVPIVFEIVE